MANPHFSIVIPCLNEEKYLPKLLTNLEKQTLKDFEVIVVDGQSEDKTLAKATSFNNRLKIKTLKADKRNVSFQRNLGAKNAKGDILIFFDADTKIPKIFIAKVCAAFEKDKTDLLTTWIKTDSKLQTDKAIAIGLNSIFEFTNFFGSPSSVGAFIGIRKSVFEKIEGFDENLKFAEDTDLLERAVKEGFNFKISRDNYYYFSLRRFKKEGTLKSIRQYALLNLNRVLKIDKFTKLPDYEMGGHLFDGKTKKESLAWIQSSINKITNQKNKKEILKPKGLSFLKSLWVDLLKEWENL